VTRLRAGDRPLGDVTSAFTVTDHISIDRFRESLGDTTLTLRGNVRYRGRPPTPCWIRSCCRSDSRLAKRGSRPGLAPGRPDRRDASHPRDRRRTGRRRRGTSVWARVSWRRARCFQGVDLGLVLGQTDSPDGIRAWRRGSSRVRRAGRSRDPGQSPGVASPRGGDRRRFAGASRWGIRRGSSRCRRPAGCAVRPWRPSRARSVHRSRSRNGCAI